MYPRIYLAIDNVFFSKRWTKPQEWAKRIADMGIRFIEASADTEHDPLFMGYENFNDWIREVHHAEEEYGIKIANLFSGHGTYSTLGLTHPDSRVREHLIKNWFFPMIRTAGELNCGMGFFAHAFDHQSLQNPLDYQQQITILEEILCRLNRYAEETGCKTLSLEQMYTPHQYPWRQKDVYALLQTVTKNSKRNFYFTEDVGHHLTKFLRPSIEDFKLNGFSGIWLGTDYAYSLAANEGITAWSEIEKEMDMNPHLFSNMADSDCYNWLSSLGCYCPIIHLQQTDGTTSSHLPFTKKRNRWGKIRPEKILHAIKQAYDSPPDPSMPERCSEIYLTMELFASTASIIPSAMEEYTESVAYWRNVVPVDGVTVDKLIEKL